jgi:ribosomal protein S18 acetylase RimI-like enzyme
LHVRHLSASDRAPITAVVDAWWGGRHVADMLQRLFFDHFQDTSWVVEEDGAIVAFLIGFLSQSRPGEAYIHFVGVHPEHRGRGLGADLYGRFFEVVRARGCTSVRCITAPVNTGSIAFHTRMGFRPEPGDAEANGVPFARDYDGPGQDRVRFVKQV